MSDPTVELTRFGFQKCAEDGCRIGLVHPESYGPYCSEHLWKRFLASEEERERLREALERIADSVVGAGSTVPKPIHEIARAALSSSGPETK